MFTTQYITYTLRWVLTAVGLVALVIGVGMTACLVATGTWSLDAWHAIDNGERPGAFIPHIIAAISSLVATSVHTFAALVTGLAALATAVLLSLAPRIAFAFSTVYWTVRVHRASTHRAAYCASLNTTAVA